MLGFDVVLSVEVRNCNDKTSFCTGVWKKVHDHIYRVSADMGWICSRTNRNQTIGRHGQPGVRRAVISCEDVARSCFTRISDAVCLLRRQVLGCGLNAVILDSHA